MREERGGCKSVSGSPELNFSAALANSQLVYLLPIGIINLVVFIRLFIYHFLCIGLEKPLHSYKYTHLQPTDSESYS